MEGVVLAQPGAPLAQACRGSLAKRKAAYRFFANDRVDMPMLLKGHVEATAQRMGQHPVVLAVQDTMTLNGMALPGAAGLGPLDTTSDEAVGLILHDTMAFTAAGIPLGLVDAQCRAREAAGTTARREGLPPAPQDSATWGRNSRALAEIQPLCPQTMLVSVGDRYGDLHALFQGAQQTPSGPQLLVRAARPRPGDAAAAAEHAYLWEQLRAAPVAGHEAAHMPGHGARAARTVTVAVRYAPVTLPPPTGEARAAVPIWAVHAQEVAPPPEVTAPLRWMLLTTVGVFSLAQAVERLRWYALRWGMEGYHRVLKDGCRAADRPLDSAERIARCLAIDLVVAWRLYWLGKQPGAPPAGPCDGVRREEEWPLRLGSVRAAPPAPVA